MASRKFEFYWLNQLGSRIEMSHREREREREGGREREREKEKIKKERERERERGGQNMNIPSRNQVDGYRSTPSTNRTG